MKEMNGSNIPDWVVVYKVYKDAGTVERSYFFKYRPAKLCFDHLVRHKCSEVELYKLTRSLKHQFKLVPDKAEVKRAKKASQPKEPVKGKRK